MRIAIFDYCITANNPSGKCHLTMLRALADEHNFTVFSFDFENPDPQRITWVRIPVPRRPLALLFLAFHLVAPVLYVWHCFSRRVTFDVIQSVESNLAFGKLIYSHFSHTTYLKQKHPGRSGWRGWLRWLDHFLHAGLEPLRYPSADLIVTPSRGLERDLRSDLYLKHANIEVIPNPIPTGSLERPASFNREGFRDNLDLQRSDVVCIFCALGHFERKGLPLLMEALCSPALGSIKLLVVGGEADSLKAYLLRSSELGIESQVRFVGFQKDARPFLWSADAFVLPSAYETFSLAAYEAAAAGLPIIAPALNGISDLLVDGETGFCIEPSIPSIAQSLERLLRASPLERTTMGNRAKRAASSYSIERFTENWRTVYRQWPSYSKRVQTHPSSNHVYLPLMGKTGRDPQDMGTDI